MLIVFRKISIFFKSKYSTLLFFLLVVFGFSNTIIAQDHYDFNYADRNSLLSDGWNFIATTPSGSSRNTEQTTGAIVSYDQQAHPGVIRIPADAGELLGSANNSRNTIFRNLSARWTSVRLKIASFAPVQNYQQAGFAVYQDDDNYLQFTRRFDGNNCIKFLKEIAGTGSNVNTINLSTTSNLYLRLDRDPSTEIIAAYYSLDGSSWNYIANTTFALNNPRLAIISGSSPGGFPNADFAWTEVSYQSPVAGDELLVTPREVVFNAVQGQPLSDIRSIFLSSGLGGILDWSFATDVSWLTPNLQSGVTDDVLKVSVNTTGIQSGVHSGNIILESPQSSINPVIIPVTLIVNPAVPVSITTWKDGKNGAMSVSVDDSQPSGFDALQANGFKGTYVLEGVTPPSFYTDYYNAGMELGSHTVHHVCETVSNDVLRTKELEPNISALCTKTPEPCKDVITLVWPCGYTNYREEAIASDYFLSARGYMINSLEEATPENFMNLKSYNSHNSPPYPPSDLKTLVDLAVQQGKWFNLVLHDLSNDDGATTYASSKSIWVASIGTVIKYIVQRQRFILTDYNESASGITYNVSRLPVASSPLKNFEQAFGSNDSTTMQIDIDDSKSVDNVFIGGVINHYQIKSLNGNMVLLTNVKLESSASKTVEIRYTNPVSINLTISGITANNKVYDRTTSATLNLEAATLVGLIAGDNVTLLTSGATGTFVNKTVGTSKTVSCSGFTISGPDASRYTLTQPTTAANISAITLTISGVTANSKVYDGTSAATLNTGSATLTGVLSGDNVTLVKTGAIGTFANKNAGTAKAVATSGFALGGTDATNYILTQPSTTGNITPATLTVSGVTASNKVYDGTTTATINTGSTTLTGIIGTDVVTLGSAGVTGTFDNANVGAGKLVTISGFTKGGTDSGNYTLVQPTTTANITGLLLTVTGVTANNRVYNGTTAATLNTGNAALSGILTGDAVTLVPTGATGAFANKNTGSNKTVSTSGFALGGADAGKYTISQPSATANITAASLTVSGLMVNNKIYDGTSMATLNTSSAVLTGVFGTDVVSLIPTSATGTFDNKNTGNNKTVLTSGFSLSGTDAGNYTLTQPTATGNILVANLSISGVTADNKVYDGSTSAIINIGGAKLEGIIGNDDITLVKTGVNGAFTNKNAGTAKTVLITGFTLSGNDATNYTLTQTSVTANITPTSLMISGVKANNKIYDGTTKANLNTAGATPQGLIGTDVVSLVFSGASGTFANKNKGADKSVTVSGIILGGTDSGNYTVIQPTTAADITAAILNVSGLTASDKVYDGTTLAIINKVNVTLIGIFESDAVTLNSSAATGVFMDKNVGTDKTVEISGLSIYGADANNYILTQPSLVADITPKTLTITANNQIKSFGTIFTFTGTEYTASGLLTDDLITDVSLSSPGAIASAHIGAYDIIISAGINSNYNIKYVNGTLTINKAFLTVTADDKSKTYGSENPELSITYTGFMTGDDISVLDTPPVAKTDAETNSDAGDYLIEVSGGKDDTYSFIYKNGSLYVKKADQVITFDEIPAGLRMTQEYQLKATATSGLQVTYECSDPDKVGIAGDIMTILGDGNLTITARQEGSQNWNPAKDVIQSIKTLPTFDNISSLFTPNNDGMNDFWYISDLEQYGKVQVTVYNRFGQMVYKSDGYKNDWDGTWNGNPLPSASYYYIIKSSLKGFIKGVVNIVR